MQYTIHTMYIKTCNGAHKSERLKERLRIQKSARRDKVKHLEDLANKAETATSRQEMSTVYMITKWVCGNTNHNIKPSVMDKEGREQTNGARTKHFKDVQISSLLTDLEIKTSPQTKAEIEAAISTLANNKAPGTDSLCAKVLKADPDIPPLCGDMEQGRTA